MHKPHQSQFFSSNHFYTGQWGFIAILLFVSLLLLGCKPALPSSTSEPTLEPEVSEIIESQPVDDGPTLLRSNITMRKIVDIGFGGMKLAVNPQNNELYYLRPAEGVFHVILAESVSTEKIVDIEDINPEGNLTGMKFASDGTLYLLMNVRLTTLLTQAEIYRGKMSESGEFIWKTLAKTEQYQTSNTNFDHLFNGLTVSPDDQWVFVSSGSRTDHGEVQNNQGINDDMREVPMTSRIFRLPADGVDLIIPNDEVAQEKLRYLFATGTRNAFDLEFAPNGDLFGVDNGPDADYPDELNWLREGQHYGFPWRFGTHDNPQQFPDYDSAQDNYLSQDFVAIQRGTYRNDPSFPSPPKEFTDPIVNLGPASVQYRDHKGSRQDASKTNETVSTFTPHLSPLGLVFLTDTKLPNYLFPEADQLSAFITSWGAAGGDFEDQGQNLLHLTLVKEGYNYTVRTIQIAQDFKRPIDAVMIENRLYVLEWDGEGTIWELTFE